MLNRVLIIDDDTELCALMKKCVKQENLEVDIAYTGRDGKAFLCIGIWGTASTIWARVALNKGEY